MTDFPERLENIRDRLERIFNIVQGGPDRPGLEETLRGLDDRNEWLMRRCAMLQEENHKLASRGAALERSLHSFADDVERLALDLEDKDLKREFIRCAAIARLAGGKS